MNKMNGKTFFPFAAFFFALASILSGADLKVGAYYYPWYHPDPALSSHWTDGHVRQFLDVPQPPELGEYDSRNSNVIRWHLQWAKDFGVDFFIASWWGADSFEDITMKDYFIQHPDMGDFKYAILYEALSDRCLGNFRGPDGLIYFNDAVKDKLIADFQYLADTYFQDDSYLTHNGEAVVFFYVSRVFRNDLVPAFTELRSTIKANTGIDLYLVGDELEWENKPDFSRISVFDAVTSYTMYSDIQEQYDENLIFSDDIGFLEDVALKYDHMAEKLDTMGIDFVPCAQPGFNDRGVRPEVDHYVLSHETKNGYEGNTFFQDYLELAGSYVDEDLNFIAITSWNEWHEDTQIEPTKLGLPDSDGPYLYTLGENHKNYEFELLQILKDFKDAYQGPRRLTCQGDVVLSEIVPEIQGDPNAKYVELFNRGSLPVDLTDWTLSVQSKTENYDRIQLVLSGWIEAKSYLLIGTDAYVDKDLVDPDFVDNTGALLSRLVHDNASVALRDDRGILVDGVGYAVNDSYEADYVEGSSKNIPTFPNFFSLARSADHQDVDNNDFDFDFSLPSPMTSRMERGLSVIPNGSIESSDGWTLGSSHTVASDRVLNGSFSLKSNLIGAGDAASTIDFPVRSNSTYKISGWIYKENGAGTAMIDLNDVANEVQLIVGNNIGGGEWTYVSGEYSTGGQSTMTLRCVTSDGPTGPIWFDDIKVEGAGVDLSAGLAGVILADGESIRDGEIIDYPTLNAHLVMQGDGNLVLYRGLSGNAQGVIWSSGSSVGSGNYFAVLQDDGNLVIYTGTPATPGSAIYASVTSGPTGDYIFGIDVDGRLIIAQGTQQNLGQEVWSSEAYFLPSNSMLLQNEILKHPFKDIFILIQGDGNVVAYRGTGFDDPSKQAYWASGVSGNAGQYFLAFQGDGNLVAYSGSPLNVGGAIWSSNSATGVGDYVFKFDENTDAPAIYTGTYFDPLDELWTAY